MAGNVWLKQGVMGTPSRQLRWAIGQLARLARQVGQDLFVTSIREGTHSAGSLHYDGNAIDFRAFGVDKEAILAVLRVGRGLGEPWTLVNEYADGHLHLELDELDRR